MHEILEKTLQTDILVIGAPNYFENIPGLLKDFIDRTHPFYKTKLLKNKKLILITVSGEIKEHTKKLFNDIIHGLVKHQKLDFIDSYCFEGLNLDDLEKNPNSKKQINEVIERIRITI
jgi:multimeric flavodoxin WrbA